MNNNLKMMKHVPIFLVFINAIFFISCSETIVTKKEASELESVNAPAIAGLFKKRVLIEDYTGTWCGNCAGVAYAIDKVYENPSNQAVTVAIHSGPDPFKFLNVAALHNYIFSSGSVSLPQARLNRNVVWSDADTNINKALNLRSNNCGLGLAIKSSVASQNLSVDVKIKFAQNYSNLKLVVYVLEDKLIYNQVNYTNYYANQTVLVNNAPVIVNFEHNHVLRTSLTNLLGDNIYESTADGQTINKNFSFNVPSNINNPDNINFVAFIVDADNNVINVRGAKINENQVLEENL